jgi:toxin ParE1/3/4
MHLALSRGARRDLKNIARYSEREWGAPRKTQYMAAIRERLAALLHRPAIGATREDLGLDYRCVPVGRHVIFYRIASDDVLVVRVLHQRMDVRLHL